MTDLSWQGPVDLDNCAREPIHIPGAIQPDGALLVVDAAGATVLAASENAAQWFGVGAARPIGRPIAEVAGDCVAAEVAAALRSTWDERYEALVTIGGSSAHVTVHRGDGALLVEVEPDDSTPVAASVLRDASMSLSRAASVASAASMTADAVRRLTGFDRVMVYRFDAEWNGEVIAEEKADRLNSYLGLHYPATDIPAQARELYRRNWIRVIGDIGYEPVALVPDTLGEPARPIDLSGAWLRSVSPIHVEYLQNMGVTASMSVSLIIEGELWGLVACHHYSGPLRPSAAQRNAAEHLAQLASLRVSEVQASEHRQRAHDLGSVVQRLAESLAAAPHWAVAETLREHEGDLLKVADATGAVVVDGGRITRFGVTPPEECIDAILGAWARRSEPFVSDRLDQVCDVVDDAAAGALCVSLAFDDRAIVAWFRDELVRTVDWGGDPHNAKIATEEGDTVRLSPRKSFEKWREVTHGRSRPWDDAEIEAAVGAARVLGGAMLRRERVTASLATDLQRAMLPESLPTVDGLRLDARSIPDGRGVVGGDWYDAFPLGAGRLAIVVGDVAGHGLAAAATMSQLRNALRAYLLLDADPAAALDRLDGVVEQLLPGDMATAIVGVVDVAAGSVELASAGHLDPMLVRDGVASFIPAARSTLLGWHRRPKSESSTHELRDGDALVLFSDGLVESRVIDLDERLDSLLAVGSRMVGAGTDVLATRVLDAMTVEEWSDDVTVLSAVVASPTGHVN